MDIRCNIRLSSRWYVGLEVAKIDPLGRLRQPKTATKRRFAFEYGYKDALLVVSHLRYFGYEPEIVEIEQEAE